jgi:hypothetical protein
MTYLVLYSLLVLYLVLPFLKTINGSRLYSIQYVPGTGSLRVVTDLLMLACLLTHDRDLTQRRLSTQSTEEIIP